MQGMDMRHDGHPWCKTKITNIKNGDGLTFKKFTMCQPLACILLKLIM